MLKALKYFWHNHKVLLVAFTLAAMLTIAFGVRMLLFGIYWNDPNHQNQPLKGWMTPRYVALSYGLERQDVRDLFGLSQAPETRITLQSIARNQNETLEALQIRLDAFVASRTAE